LIFLRKIKEDDGRLFLVAQERLSGRLSSWRYDQFQIVPRWFECVFFDRWLPFPLVHHLMRSGWSVDHPDFSLVEKEFLVFDYVRDGEGDVLSVRRRVTA
jgi:hypothetical protein